MTDYSTPNGREADPVWREMVRDFGRAVLLAAELAGELPDRREVSRELARYAERHVRRRHDAGEWAGLGEKDRRRRQLSAHVQFLSDAERWWRQLRPERPAGGRAR